MEFVSDFFARRFAPAHRPCGDERTPEWDGIRLRLAAAQAARREILAAGLAASAHRGSFAAGAATALAEISSCKRVVNPDDLEGGNLLDGWDGSSAVMGPKVLR
jgi:hypothetical protein